MGKTKNFEGKVPLTPSGGIVSYPVESPAWRKEDLGWAWCDNRTFVGTLRFTGIERGRSAAHFVVEDDAGNKHTMFMKDALDVMRRCRVQLGKVTSTWTFCKRGANYGICLATIVLSK